MGYTVRTMTAGMWAYTNARDFEETLLEVINAGGDTDTNGAVAGAVLGEVGGGAGDGAGGFESVAEFPEIKTQPSPEQARALRDAQAS